MKITSKVICSSDWCLDWFKFNCNVLAFLLLGSLFPDEDSEIHVNIHEFRLHIQIFWSMSFSREIR